MLKNFVKLVAFKVLQIWYGVLLHLHEYSTYCIDFLYLQLKCNIKLNCNKNSISNQLCKLKIKSFFDVL